MKQLSIAVIVTSQVTTFMWCWGSHNLKQTFIFTNLNHADFVPKPNPDVFVPNTKEITLFALLFAWLVLLLSISNMDSFFWLSGHLKSVCVLDETDQFYFKYIRMSSTAPLDTFSPAVMNLTKSLFNW